MPRNRFENRVEKLRIVAKYSAIAICANDAKK